jgi:hypothetical protein
MRRRVALPFVLTLLAASAVRTWGDGPAPVAPPPAAPAARPEAVEGHADAWRDEKIVAARFEEALAAVEKECRAKFGTRPTVRISTNAEVRSVIAGELGRFKVFAGHADVIEDSLDSLGDGAVASYESGRHLVHVIPEGAEMLAAALEAPDLLSEAVLRVVLVHECANALDFERFGWNAKREGFERIESHLAFGAISKGHAQFVAARIAASWGLTRTFERCAWSITALPRGLPPALAGIWAKRASRHRFAYEQGAVLFENVFLERGDQGVVGVLANPPSTVRAIEHPEELLHPDATRRPPDLDVIVDVVQSIAPQPPWAHVTRTVSEAELRSHLIGASPADGSDVLDGLLEARARNADQIRGTLASVALRFRTPEQAIAFTKTFRNSIELRDRRWKSDVVRLVPFECVDGVGTKVPLPGFVAHRDFEMGASVARGLTAAAAVGTIAYQVEIADLDGVDHALVTPIFEAVAAYVVDPAHPKPTLPPELLRRASVTIDAPEVGGPVFKARVAGTDGRLVPRADVFARVEYRRGRWADVWGAVVAGKLEMRVPSIENLHLIVFRARDELDRPGIWGPMFFARVEASGEPFEVRLPKAVAIGGRVETASSRGVAGVRVRAYIVVRASIGAIGPRPAIADAVQGEATTDADGMFTLGGLGDLDYWLAIDAPEGFVGPAPVVARGGTTAAPIRIGAPRTSIVTVLDDDGNPVVGADVHASSISVSTEGETSYARLAPDVSTDMNGRARIADLAPETAYALSITPRRTGRALASSWTPVWDGSNIQIELDRLYVVRGVVVNSLGRTIPYATVVARDPSGQEARVMAGREGDFEFRGIRIGFVDLVAGPAAPEGAPLTTPADPAWVRVKPEYAPVRLVLKQRPAVLTISDLPAGRPVHVASVEPPIQRYVVESGAGGIIPLTDLPGEHVSIYVAATATDRRCLYAKDVTLSTDPTTLSLVTGVATRGSFADARKLQLVRVVVAAPWGPEEVRLTPDGSFETPPLPPGDYALSGTARERAKIVTGSMNFHTGETVRLKLGVGASK